jgi:hypothetical protein
LTIETPDAIATQVLNVLFYGLPVEQLQSFRERVNAVRVDDIERVARYYLRPDRLSIVLVGDTAAFASQLRGVGFGTFEVVDADSLDLMAVDFKRAGAAPGGAGAAPGRPTGNRPGYQRSDTQSVQGPSITPEEGARAQSLLATVIAAKGGLERLKGIKSLTAKTRAETVTPSGQPISAETVTYLEYPARVRVETTAPEATIIQVFDGERGWVKDPKGVHDVPERSIRDFQTSLRRDVVAVLLAAHDGRVRTRRLPDGKDDSGRQYHALEMSGTDLRRSRNEPDRETGVRGWRCRSAAG